MENNINIPDNYTTYKSGKITIYAREKYKEDLIKLEKCIADNLKLAAKHNETLKGRGNCLTLCLNDTNEKVVIRRYKHGGFLGLLAGDIFWNRSRPSDELTISDKAAKAGLSTVEVVGVIKRKIFYPFFKAEIITKEIAGSIDLILAVKQLLRHNEKLACNKKEIIRKVALMVKKMHDIGIYHADLHLKNILLIENRAGNYNIHIIDLDKSSLSHSVNIKDRMKNLYRLDRSVVKLEMSLQKECVSNKKTFPITGTDRIRFLKEYMKDSNFEINNWKSLIKNSVADYGIHKLRWNVLSRITGKGI